MEKRTFTNGQTLNRDQILVVIRMWYEVLQRQQCKGATRRDASNIFIASAEHETFGGKRNNPSDPRGRGRRRRGRGKGKKNGRESEDEKNGGPKDGRTRTGKSSKSVVATQDPRRLSIQTRFAGCAEEKAMSPKFVAISSRSFLPSH